MLLRDAVTPEPDYPFARRVALFAGVLTAGVIASTIAMIACGERTPPPAPALALHVPPSIEFAQMNRPFDPEDVTRANAELDTYVAVAYRAWTHATNATCPRTLLDVNRMMPELHAVDPWGIPYQFVCGAEGFAMRSAGPDQTYDTTDDLWR